MLALPSAPKGTARDERVFSEMQSTEKRPAESVIAAMPQLLVIWSPVDCMYPYRQTIQRMWQEWVQRIQRPLKMAVPILSATASLGHDPVWLAEGHSLTPSSNASYGLANGTPYLCEMNFFTFHFPSNRCPSCASASSITIRTHTSCNSLFPFW